MTGIEQKLEQDFPRSELELSLDNISKNFGKVRALDHASLHVRKGSIHALLGENGAGKTTLMRVAFGMIRPDSGSISVRGTPVQFGSPADAIASGIGMVHQQFSLVPEMTVTENVALGGQGKYDRKATADRIGSISRRMGMPLNPFAKVSTLTSSEKQKLEIVRTLAHDARILILDEPTAVLTPRDVGDLFAQLKEFAHDGGSVVLITHKLRDALQNADEVTVLRHGRQTLAASMASVDEEILATAMLGEETSSPSRVPAVRRPVEAKVVLQLKDLSLTDERGIQRLAGVSLQVNAGEILGVAALEGAAHAMLRLMAGRREPTSGVITQPEQIGFVPEDRQDDAIIPELSLTENMLLGNANSFSGRIDWPAIDDQTTTAIKEFDVRASGARATAANLSGGNQQKFVLARELRGNPALLVLENPTQGLDVGATDAIHARIISAARKGMSVVIYSSDLDELALLSDRVIVVGNGMILPAEPDRTSIGTVLLQSVG